MSKRKKTRQQKIIADLHRKLQLQNQATTETYTFTNPMVNKKVLLPSQNLNTFAMKDSSQYQYLTYDLLKTLFLTTGIIVIELILLAILKSHIFVLPIVRF